MVVETVRGPVDVDALGVTLMHEHVFVLTPDVMQNYGAWPISRSPSSSSCAPHRCPATSEASSSSGRCGRARRGQPRTTALIAT